MSEVVKVTNIPHLEGVEVIIPQSRKRVVMCQGTWPEDGYKDFEVTLVRDNETDEQATARAREAYGDDRSYYIKDRI